MKKEKTKAFILERISPVFNKYGYIGTSLSDLVEATGITKRTLYDHIGHKDELAYQAFHLNVKKVISPLSDALTLCENPKDKLFTIIEYYRNYYKKAELIGGCPILSVGIHDKYNNPKLYEKAKKLSLSVISGLAQIIQDGIDQKLIKSHVNAQVLARNIYCMIEGGVFMAFNQENPVYIDNILDHVDHLIHEILV